MFINHVCFPYDIDLPVKSPVTGLKCMVLILLDILLAGQILLQELKVHLSSCYYKLGEFPFKLF